MKTLQGKPEVSSSSGEWDLMLLFPSVASERCKQGELFPPAAFCHLSTPAATVFCA